MPKNPSPQRRYGKETRDRVLTAYDTGNFSVEQLATQEGVAKRNGRALLTPIAKRILEPIANSSHVNADETPIQIIRIGHY